MLLKNFQNTSHSAGGEVLTLFVVQEICQPVSMFPAMVIARLGHLIGLLPLSQYINTRGEWIYWWKYVRLHHSGSWYAPFKLVTPGPSSSWPITVKTWMTLHCCTLHTIHCINTVIVVFFFCFSPASLTDLCHRWLPGQCPAGGLWWTCRTPRPVQVQVRGIHKRANRLPTTLSGCVSSFLRNSIQYNFSQTNMLKWTLKIWFQSETQQSDFF